MSHKTLNKILHREVLDSIPVTTMITCKSKIMRRQRTQKKNLSQRCMGKNRLIVVALQKIVFALLRNELRYHLKRNFLETWSLESFEFCPNKKLLLENF